MLLVVERLSVLLCSDFCGPKMMWPGRGAGDGVGDRDVLPLLITQATAQDIGDRYVLRQVRRGYQWCCGVVSGRRSA